MQKKNPVVRFSTKKRAGFTLIELLVVIAIIAILAAILFPVFARARENARRTACLNNVKQLSMAMMQYTQDYDEQLPVNGRYDATSRPGQKSWDVAIAPYTGVKVEAGVGPLVFRCPSDTSRDTARSYAMPYFGMYGPGNTASMVLGYDTPTSTMIGVKLADIPQPAETILLSEFPSSPPGVATTDPTYVNNAFANYSNSYIQAPTKALGGSFAQDRSRPENPSHLEGWNYVFSDGHAKWMKPERTMVGVTTNMAQRVPGNLWARIKQ